VGMCADSIVGEFGGQVGGDKDGISSLGLIIFTGPRASAPGRRSPFVSLYWASALRKFPG